TSKSDGTYKLSSLAPGTYHVREVVKSGYAPKIPVGGSVDVPMASGEDKKQNFGNKKIPVGSSTIKGIVFNDTNGNGKKETGKNPEKALSGWTVFLDTDNDRVFDDGEPKSTTNSSGSYSFSKLFAGTYHVREVVKSG